MTQLSVLPRFIAASFFTVGLLSASFASAADAARSSSVEVYGLIPFELNSKTTLGPLTTQAKLDTSDIFSSLQWYSSVRASTEQDRLGLLLDLSYVKLGQDVAKTTQNGLVSADAKLGVTQGVYDIALFYRYGDAEKPKAEVSSYSWTPYAGVRVIDAKLNVEVELKAGGFTFDRERSFGRTWAQPLIGLQYNRQLSSEWSALARADLAGFDLSGSRDLSGNLQLGLGYAMNDAAALNLSWRYFGIDYKKDNDSGNGFKTTQQGLELGVKFFF